MSAPDAVRRTKHRRAIEKRFLTADRSPQSALELAETLYKIPALLTTWTRCGKAGCRCTTGHLHGPYYALHWREGQVQRRHYVAARDEPSVRAALDLRRRQRADERAALADDLALLRRLSLLRREFESLLAEQED